MRSLSFFLEQRYPFSVTPDPDGGFFIAFPDLPGCFTQVDRLQEIGAAANEIRTLWLETAYAQGAQIPLPQDNTDYSGKFVVRMPRHVHRQLAASAAREGVSLNQYVVALLTQGDAVARVERRLAEMEERIDALARGGSPECDDATERRRAALAMVGSESTTS